LILESYGRIVAVTEELKHKGYEHPNILKYLQDAQNVLDGFNLIGALNMMRSIESEINRFYQQVAATPQLAYGKNDQLLDFPYIHFTPTTNFEKLISPFLGRWSKIRSEPRCNSITEFNSIKPADTTNPNNNLAPKIVVAMYRDGAKILESEYQALETQPGQLDLGKGGIVSVHSDQLRWNHGNSTSEYIRCP
ncbi:hypothetical protein ACFL17_10365, partial [Pseudomonadota bacterium]